MSTSPPPPAPVPPLPPAPGATPQQIKVVSHSMLLYWWPVWFFGFVFALITFIDNKRMVIVDQESSMEVRKNPDGVVAGVTIWSPGTNDQLVNRDSTKNDKDQMVPKVRVSPRSWIGPMFFTIIFLII